MHNVLARQLRRFGLTADEPPATMATWAHFLERIEGFYDGADQNRYLLERSLRKSSDELIAANQALVSQAEEEIAEGEARYRNLFKLSRIATWEENFEGAAAALDALRDSGVSDLAEHLRANLDQLAEIIARVEVTGVNPAVAELVRSSDPESLIGPISATLVTEESAEAWIAQLLAIWDRLDSVRVDDLVGTRQDGELFHGFLEWHAPRIGRRFDYRRVVVTIVDITEMIEAERRMRGLLESQDAFLASISHELRTPLTSVLGFAEILLESGVDSSIDDRASMLELIATQAADLSDIVDDLLVAARTGAGRLTVGSVPVDLRTEVVQTIDAARNINSPVDVPVENGAVVYALGDAKRVRQIVRNLVSNAIKYGGPQIGVEFEAAGDDVFLRVIDNGEGLDDEAAGRVFERYFRSDFDDGRTASVGIGLTISRDLARMMDGDLFYEPDDGRTVFTLRLPAAPRSAVARAGDGADGSRGESLAHSDR